MFSMTPFRLLSASVLLLSSLTSCTRPTLSTPARSPERATQDLLNADREWSRRAASVPFAVALSAMFADGVMMPLRSEILTGRTAVMTALATSPDTAARLRWTPVRAGLAADAHHGFTVGFLVATRPDGTQSYYKYLAYWVRESSGWRVAAWRRRPMNTVAIDSTILSPLVPEQLVLPSNNAAEIAGHRRGLMAVEGEFSNEANRIGVGAAFAQFGASDAVNVGPPTAGAFIVGAEAIARSVAGTQPLNAPSPIVWGADTALVASSGDLGITFGVIRAKNPPAGTPPNAGAAFFTIWRKASRAAPWRYVAE